MAEFTLSLDCEGLWGMADSPKVTRAGVIRDEALAKAYAQLSEVLERQQIRATAAFVSCFAVEPDVVVDNLPALRELSTHAPEWFRAPLRAVERRAFDGWTGSGYYRQLARAGHEMGFHGATHLTLAPSTSEAAVAIEMALAARLFDALGHAPTALVFPRNLVGHLEQLRALGLRTYRAAPARTPVERVRNLLGEWNVLDRRVQAKPVRDGDWYVSPAGHFLNWPSGVRALVPGHVTVARWRSLLRAAVETDGYVHMWFHPHNFITAPKMVETFQATLREVASLVRSKDLVNVTMSEGNRLCRPGGDL